MTTEKLTHCVRKLNTYFQVSYCVRGIIGILVFVDVVQALYALFGASYIDLLKPRVATCTYMYSRSQQNFTK